MTTTRALGFTLAFLGAACLGGVSQAEQPVRGESPFRTAEYSAGDVEVVQVRNGRYRRGRSYNRRYYNYSPYRYRYGYNYQPYPYRSYRYYGTPRYGTPRYGTPRYGYYRNYGLRGGVRIGPFGVWW